MLNRSRYDQIPGSANLNMPVVEEIRVQVMYAIIGRRPEISRSLI